MMRFFVAAGVVLALLCSAAFSADLPTNGAPKPAATKKQEGTAAKKKGKKKGKKGQASKSTKTAAEKTSTTKAEKKREPQAISDAQLHQAQQLLSAPLTLAKLQAAHKLLSEANHDYDGHRKMAAEEIENAIKHFSSNPGKASQHIKEANKEMGTALLIK
jgi:organic radical activating enzyme